MEKENRVRIRFTIDMAIGDFGECYGRLAMNANRELSAEEMAEVSAYSKELVEQGYSQWKLDHAPVPEIPLADKYPEGVIEKAWDGMVATEDVPRRSPPQCHHRGQ